MSLLSWVLTYCDLNLQNYQKIVIFPDINFPKNHRKSQNLRLLRITNFVTVTCVVSDI